MALIFQRLARNFIKNGYFPTDSETLAGIIARLCFDSDNNKKSAGVIRMLDPCCGEGVALAEIAHYLNGHTKDHKMQSVGIEIDKERAYHAKSLANLDTVVHTNISDCIIGTRQFGLLLLNPPYGDMTSDKAGLSNSGGRERYETMFYDKTNKLLQFGGVLVLIVPHHVLNEKFAKLLASHFREITIYKAPEQRFKQVVLFGIRTKARAATQNVVDTLLKAQADINVLEVLTPELASNNLYQVPLSEGRLRLKQIKIDAQQLSQAVADQASLWGNFNSHFANIGKKEYPPLRKMSNWHLALALAAGQIAGVVESSSGKTFLVKGNTFKDKKTTTQTQVNSSGAMTETRTATDVFVPVIRAIDFTKGSATFGEVMIIR